MSRTHTFYVRILNVSGTSPLFSVGLRVTRDGQTLQTGPC